VNMLTPKVCSGIFSRYSTAPVLNHQMKIANVTART